MFTAATEGDVDLVEYHVTRGVDVDYVHPEILGTALVASILARKEEVALYLLDHGANPNLVSDFEGLSPLQAARQAGLEAVESQLLGLGVEDVAVPTAGVASTESKHWLSRLWERLV